MKIILLGPPGAGKGTQSELLRKALGDIPHIATGDMLRAAIRKGDAFGSSIQATVESGKFISDETIIVLVRNRIAEPDCENGFILDGFPRTPAQAAALEKAGITIDYVIQIAVPDDLIVRRIVGRRIHEASGRTYNIYFHPSQRDGLDDVTGEALIQRADDNEQTVRERLSVYHQKTEPLIAWYKHKAEQHHIRFVAVDGTQDEQSVCEEILTRMRSTISPL